MHNDKAQAKPAASEYSVLTDLNKGISLQVFYLTDETSSSKSGAWNRTETSLKNSVGAFLCLFKATTKMSLNTGL